MNGITDIQWVLLAAAIIVAYITIKLWKNFFWDHSALRDWQVLGTWIANSWDDQVRVSALVNSYVYRRINLACYCLLIVVLDKLIKESWPTNGRGKYKYTFTALTHSMACLSADGVADEFIDHSDPKAYIEELRKGLASKSIKILGCGLKEIDWEKFGPSDWSGVQSTLIELIDKDRIQIELA